jgi:ankyrin repeat protein
MKSALKEFQKKSQGPNKDNKLEVLSSAYEQAMERINGQREGFQLLAKNVLSWITYAKRPLTISELQHALAVEDGESELDEDNLPEIEDMVSVCAGLVTVDEESNIIRLIHYTTQEYFERTRGILFPNAEADITTTCITYLSFSIFDSGFCQRDENLEERLRDNPLYEYAARNWGRHALEASQTEDLIMKFFGSEVKLEASVQAMLAFNEGLFHADCAEYEPRHMTGLHLGAYFGLKETIESLLMTSRDPDLEDSFGRTPLSWAAQRGHIAVVQQLLGKGAEADPVDTFGRTPLSWAAENGHTQVVQQLLEEGANPDLKDGNNDITPLSHAAFNGHLAMVQLLIREGADPEAEDGDGRTPLSWAAELGQSEVVQELFENGADPESVDNDGWTPLSWAAFGGYEGVVRLLLEKGVDADSKDNSGKTPLSYAAVRGHEATVRLLLDKGADVESKSKNGQTPLSYAAERGHEAVVQLLLDRGADIESKNKRYGWTPLPFAAARGNQTVLQLLQSYGAQSSK